MLNGWSSLVPALLATLPEASILFPLLPPIITATLSLALTSKDPSLVERAFDTFALIFRDFARDWATQATESWNLIRTVLGWHDMHGIHSTDFLESSERIDIESGHQSEEENFSPSNKEHSGSISASSDAGSKEMHAAVIPRRAVARHQPQRRRLVAAAFAYVIRAARQEQLDNLMDTMIGDVESLTSAHGNEQAAVTLGEGVAWIVVESVKVSPEYVGDSVLFHVCLRTL